MEAVDGRAPVIAGVIANSTRDAVRRGAARADLGVAALQVTPVHYLFRPDDDALLEFFRAVAEQTGLPVIIYNVVPWCYLAPDLLCRILREVPGVIGVKQSAGDMKLLADLLREAPGGQPDTERGRRHALPVVRARRPRRGGRRFSARRPPPASHSGTRWRAATIAAPSTCMAGSCRCVERHPTATTCRPA